ncbi:hypothetical protein OS493_001348 [Desmophyllum pertusum]|uniref:Uncharacterized protein n=1 Tax=Desmophyllum pertusum TaxID=174260 RepID=A0A9W9ZGE0_9CNID|nr:hypothetical protein OS493_001348 [Desmophyllum pertusum]
MEFSALFKRKTRESSRDSTSPSKVVTSPDSKRVKEGEEEDKELHVASATEILTSPNESNDEASQDVVITALDMAEDFASKVNEILVKVQQLDTIALQITSLQESVNKINTTVAGLQHKFNRLKEDVIKTAKETNAVKEGISMLNTEMEASKTKLQELENNTQIKLEKLRLQVLNYEVYNRRKNLRFYGIPEEGEDEDTKEVLYHFIERELQYADREITFGSHNRVTTESGYGISVDLPKEVTEMRKKLIPKMVEARTEGKRAACSRAEPYKLYIDGVEVK